MKLEFVGATHQGRRSNNEDALRLSPELGLFVVADGMGGYEGGEVASHIAVDTIHDFFQRNADDAEATWPHALDRSLSFVENLMALAVGMAHEGIVSRKQGELAQMGTTVAALALCNGTATIAHVGDSRVYRLRDGDLQQLTRDHSLHAELMATGADVPQRSEFAYGHVITRALGMASSAQPDLRSEPVLPGDLFLLCTDGLIERLDTGSIRAALIELPSPQVCRQLVEQAFERGGKDNITAIVVRVR